MTFIPVRLRNTILAVRENNSIWVRCVAGKMKEMVLSAVTRKRLPITSMDTKTKILIIGSLDEKNNLSQGMLNNNNNVTAIRAETRS